MRLLILLFLFSQLAMAGFEPRRIGSRPAALGEAFAAVSDDAWSVFYNPSGLSSLSSFAFSAFYSPRPFGFSELSVKAAAAGIPTSTGTVAAGMSVYGFDLYREISGVLCFSRSIAGIGAGIAVAYYHVSIAQYGSAGAVGIDAGALLPLSPKLSWGIWARNLNSPSIGSSGETLPQSFATGLAYSPIGSMIVVLDLEKESDFAASPRGGIEYRPVESIALRGGLTDQPSQLTAGIGVRVGVVGFDYSFVSHEELGGSHEFSITIR